MASSHSPSFPPKKEDLSYRLPGARVVLTPPQLPPPFLCSTSSCSLWLPCGEPRPHSLDRAPGVNPSQRQPGPMSVHAGAPCSLAEIIRRHGHHAILQLPCRIQLPSPLRSWFQKMPFHWLPSSPGSLFPEFLVLSNKLCLKPLVQRLLLGEPKPKT